MQSSHINLINKAVSDNLSNNKCDNNRAATAYIILLQVVLLCLLLMFHVFWYL